MRPATFEALREPRFRRYWFAQFLSLIGTWMQASAQSWLVLGLFRDPAEATVRLGVVAALQFLPSLGLSLVAGALLDRVSRKRVLLVSQTVLMASSIALGTAVGTGRVTFGIVAALALLSGFANAFDIPARQAMVPSLISRERLTNAVAMNSLSFNAARVLGASLFGAISPFLGLASVFYLNSLSFVALLLVLAPMRVPAPEDGEHQNLLADIKAGLAYVAGTPEVRGPILLLGALSLTVINFQVIIPAFAKNALGLSEAGFGALGSLFGAGAVVGAIWQASQPGNRRGRMMRVGAVALTLAVAALSFARGLAPAGAALLVAGAGMILFTVSANSTVQLTVPDALRGRVMSVFTLVFAGMSPFGALLVGSLMGALGPRGGILAAAGIGALGLTLLWPRRSARSAAGAADD